MICARTRHAGGDHVAVADRLDLLQVVLVDERGRRGAAGSRQRRLRALGMPMILVTECGDAFVIVVAGMPQ